MDDIQLASTVVAQTGTGELFVARSSGPDTAIFRESVGVGATRKLMTHKRTLAKPVKGFSGMERGEIIMTEFLTENDVEYPISVRFVTSIPVTTDATTRARMVKRAQMLAHDASFAALINSQDIPL